MTGVLAGTIGLVLRVMSWNLWWRFGPWWPRQRAIGETLQGVDADVIGLQEVWAEQDGANQAEILAELLGYDAVQTDLRYHEGLAFSNAILSRWAIDDAESRALPGADGRPGHRSVLYARVRAPFGPLPVFTTHLDWQFDASAARLAQVAALSEFVDEHRNPTDTGFPAVVTGDFNATPDSDEIRAMTGRTSPPVSGLVFTDAWEVGGDGSAGLSWSRCNPHLRDATWPERRLDYVFVSWPRPSPLGTTVRCRLAGQDPIGGVVPSDHYGVVAELRTH